MPFPYRALAQTEAGLADDRLHKRYSYLLNFAFANVLASIKGYTMPEEFPAVEGGGSLILAWQIRNKRVLVVGGGEVSPLHLCS